MKWSLVLFILMALCAFVSCESNSPSQNPEPNFAITFEFGSCNRDILDTFNNTFTKDMSVDPAVTIPFQLTNTQATEIYQKMVEIDLWDYPDVFSVAIPKHGTVGIVTPAMSYRITVRNGDMTKTLFWVDEIIDPKTPEAERLRSLFLIIIEMIQNSPEYKRMPEPKVGCV